MKATCVFYRTRLFGWFIDDASRGTHIVAFTDRLKDFYLKQIRRRRRPAQWPFAPGKYYVVDPTAPVVVILPDNDSMAADLAALSVRGLCMVSPVCRSTTDIEKLIRNIDSNLAVHFVLLAGGHSLITPAVEALRVLFNESAHASDKAAAMVHAVRGRQNALDFAALTGRVKLVDMLDCDAIDKVVNRVNRLDSDATRPNTGFVVQSHDTTLGIERVIAASAAVDAYRPDKAGRYVIGVEGGKIVIEHYNSKDELLRIVEGTTARDLCVTLIRNGWVSKLDHAAYLGRELMRAEASLAQGGQYAQSPEASGHLQSAIPDSD